MTRLLDLVARFRAWCFWRRVPAELNREHRDAELARIDRKRDLLNETRDDR